MKKYSLLFCILCISLLISCQKKEAKIETTPAQTTIQETTTVVETTTVPETTTIQETVPLETKGLKENFPRIDGSTANMPMMAQIRASYLGEKLTEAENNIEVTTTDYAWRNLLEGKNDLLLVYEPSSETKKIIDESPVKLKVTPIGVDALVFIVNEKNPVNNLTSQNLQDIYSGKIKNWKEVGGEDKEIIAFQRPLNSGSQTLFLNLLMKNVKPVEPPKQYIMQGMGDLIEGIASYNDKANALGYSVYYYAKKMYSVPGLKLISVDNIQPTDETIANGSYPYLNQYYLVIREDTPKDSETMKLYNYIISEEGKKDIKKAGYIPVSN